MNKCICVRLLNLGVFCYIAVSTIVLCLALSGQAALLDHWSSVCRYAGVQRKHVIQHLPAFDSDVL